METCPKCGYERQPKDEHFSEGECPRCGIVYGKFVQSEIQCRAAKAATERLIIENRKLAQRQGKRRTVIALIIVSIISVATYTVYSGILNRKEDTRKWDQIYAEASSFANAGRYNESLDLAKLALAKAECERRIDKRKLFEIRLLTAKCYEGLGEYQLALKCLEDLKADQEQLHGANHADIRKTMAAVSSVYSKKGDSEKAKSIISQVVKESEKELASSLQPLPHPRWRSR